MKKSTVGLGLLSEREDWFTSSSVGDGIPRQSVEKLSQWLFEAGCQRLQGGGWEASRQVTLSVMSHADITRITDKSRELETRFHPAMARQIMEHLFEECMTLVYGEQV